MVFHQIELYLGYTTLGSFASLLQIGWLQLVFHLYLLRPALPESTAGRFLHYRILSVTIENTTHRILTIQKRVTIFASL
jgi:hypothetical protein